ncbi:MAG: hypothetical protein MZV63_16750 [Marinilabiliales bacterium]|nr:hypothetical protein [Marinilabiliales bacterium]
MGLEPQRRLHREHRLDPVGRDGGGRHRRLPRAHRHFPLLAGRLAGGRQPGAWPVHPRGRHQLACADAVEPAPLRAGHRRRSRPRPVHGDGDDGRRGAVRAGAGPPRPITPRLAARTARHSRHPDGGRVVAGATAPLLGGGAADLRPDRRGPARGPHPRVAVRHSRRDLLAGDFNAASQ